MPWHTAAVAEMIHREFWTDKPGATATGMQARLATADHPDRLAVPHVYLGTDGPGFYTRLGAMAQEKAREDFWFMRFDL